jgi:two-component system, chemotaxis family, protein-glutamate methylesterase/glutaminase
VSARRLRVLLVEDSAVTREYLGHVLASRPELQVVGTAADGIEAVEQARRLRPDVVVMDVHMPRANGYDASQRIMEEVPTPIVMMTAAGNPVPRRPEAVGALMLVEKPTGAGPASSAATERRLVQAVKLMAEVKVIRRWARPRRIPEPPVAAGLGGRRVRCVAIGASAGGPAALVEILGPLGPDLTAPIVVVQHIATGFVGGLVDWLAQATRLTAKVAEAGERTIAGRVYLAPDGRHMGIDAHGEIRLTEESAADGFCPSISHLFSSVADAFGAGAVGILLTGMGRDGADGLLRLRAAGGLTIAQDEASCMVFGMPQEAIRLGAARHVLSPEQITSVLHTLIEAA